MIKIKISPFELWERFINDNDWPISKPIRSERFENQPEHIQRQQSGCWNIIETNIRLELNLSSSLIRFYRGFELDWYFFDLIWPKNITDQVADKMTDKMTEQKQNVWQKSMSRKWQVWQVANKWDNPYLSGIKVYFNPHKKVVLESVWQTGSLIRWSYLSATDRFKGSLNHFNSVKNNV